MVPGIATIATGCILLAKRLQGFAVTALRRLQIIEFLRALTSGKQRASQ